MTLTHKDSRTPVYIAVGYLLSQNCMRGYHLPTLSDRVRTTRHTDTSNLPRAVLITTCGGPAKTTLTQTIGEG